MDTYFVMYRLSKTFII